MNCMLKNLSPFCDDFKVLLEYTYFKQNITITPEK